jgi:hypothetical protein
MVDEHEHATGDPIRFLEKWVATVCNGDWEHGEGIQLRTLDNPGWWLSVDLAGTPWASIPLARIQEVRSEVDWIDCSKRGCVFEATGGLANLQELLTTFAGFVSGRPIAGE